MRYLKIFSLIIFIIAMLVTLFISIRSFLGNIKFLNYISRYYIPSIIFLIIFIFLIIYIIKTKNIYSLVASLFLTTSCFIFIWFLLNLATVINRQEIYSGPLLISFIVSSSIGLVFFIGFITLFFFFRSKSEKYVLKN